MHYPKISIVTPSYNAGAFLERTIRSLIDQSYPNLEYIIMDGGSTDGSVDIIRKYESHLKYWCSEKDGGMYDALQKGFARSTGDILGWLNADDRHHKGSLFQIAQIFTDFKKISWLQGTPNIIDENDRIVYASPRLEIDRFFFYQKKHLTTGLFVQQESTFWRRELWERGGSYISQEYRYAADFELWIRFFKIEQLYLTPALLGSFRYSRSGQASMVNQQEYYNETLRILEKHPLNGREKRYLGYLNFFEKINSAFNLFGWIDRKLKGRDKSVVRAKLRFDPATQRFKGPKSLH